MPKKRLLIVESDPGTKVLLEYALSQYYSIVALVNDGYAAVDVAFNLEPDLVLIDVDLCRSLGGTLIKWLKDNSPSIKIVAFSFKCLSSEIREIMEAGADAYCLKGTSLEELKKALLIATLDGTYISSGLNSRSSKRQQLQSYSN